MLNKGIPAHAAGLALLLLNGCGGAGLDTSAPPPAPSAAEGMWTGATNTNRSVTGLVFGDGLYYVFYSAPNNASLIAGVIQGTGTSNGASFTSANARDFNLEGLGVQSATFAATAVAKNTLSGTISYTAGGAPVTFASTYSAAYETRPTLAALAGTFTGQIATSEGIENTTLAIAADGKLTGSGVSGCTGQGTVAPRAKGNAFTFSLKFNGSPCLFEAQTLNGIAYFEGGIKKLWAVAPNAARTDSILFIGTKP